MVNMIHLDGIEATLEDQLRVEVMATEQGKEEYLEARRKGTQVMPPEKLLLHQLMEARRDDKSPSFVEAIAAWLAGPATGKAAAIKQCVEGIPPLDLAWLTVNTLISVPDFKVVSAQYVFTEIAKEIQDHIEYLEFRKANPQVEARVQKNTKGNNREHRRKAVMAVKHSVCGVSPCREWKTATQLQVGKQLVDLLMQSTGAMDKAKGTSSASKQRVSQLRWSDEIQAKLDKLHELCSINSAKFLPTVIPPKPWTDLQGGGFYSQAGRHRLRMIKHPVKVEPQYFLGSNFSKVYACLNALQETPWQINQGVLDVAHEIAINTNGLGVIPKPEFVEMPPKPWGESEEEYEAFKAEQPEAFAKALKARKEAFAKIESLKGKAQATAQTLTRAAALKCLERFYFCWTTDYRGRIYPVQLYLTPQGNDLQKALLRFADGVALGEHGGKWLAIHGANCSAFEKVDKKSFEKRIQWVYDHEEQIIDSGLHPLDGRMWWAQLDWDGNPIHDDPWLFLAFCMEWAQYAASGYSKEFVSHLPIAMDGSCNGLQNFAGLLKDEVGGAAVNLLPQEEPNDIYTQVADLLTELVHGDLTSTQVRKVNFKAKGSEEARTVELHVAALAKAWDGKIDRKLVKRGIMTTPYGVTSYGLREQIEEQLEERGTSYLGVPTGEYWKYAIYLSDRLAEAIDGVVSSANECKMFFKAVAKVFSDADIHMSWDTPSGFRVVQKCVEYKTKQVATYWGKQKVRVDLSLKEETDKLAKNKALSKISPNVVHSFDAAHLCATVNACVRRNISQFAMIHDSYGCPAGHMEVMAEVLREEFIKLYSKPALANWYESVKRYLPLEYHAQLPELPQMGTLDLIKVRESHYFFA